jgi:hypothetical protein
MKYHQLEVLGEPDIELENVCAERESRLMTWDRVFGAQELAAAVREELRVGVEGGEAARRKGKQSQQEKLRHEGLHLDVRGAEHGPAPRVDIVKALVDEATAAA